MVGPFPFTGRKSEPAGELCSGQRPWTPDGLVEVARLYKSYVADNQNCNQPMGELVARSIVEHFVSVPGDCKQSA